MMLAALLWIAVDVQRLNAIPADLKKTFTAPGVLAEGIAFSDLRGSDKVKNVVFVWIETTKKGTGIFGYHFVLDAQKGWTQLWRTQDGVYECELDSVARYLPTTLHATDIDKNGTYETWFAYETACHGDVSPTSIKLLMHEGDKKYALRGRGKAPSGPNGSFEGGDSTPDDAFKSAPSAFLTTAKKRFTDAVDIAMK